MTCEANFNSYGDTADCLREENHKGQHFGWVDTEHTRHATWKEAGGNVVSSSVIAYECEFCGLPTESVKDNYSKGVFPAHILEQYMCFACMYWTSHKELRDRNEPDKHDDKLYFIADWVAFVIPQTVGSSSPASFGPFVHKTTGEKIERQQMWCQGVIPEEYRDWFKNEYESAPMALVSEFKGF